MDTNYSYNSYPESGGSSPRSREIDFDNPPPWEDQSNTNTPNYKVKLMCSYGGKIHPRPHDNQLAYIGGETKILAVDRSIKFTTLLNKLSAIIPDADISFKYQLPGEDLDALISVTNDDDLDHMMNEYDRLNRASPKPARLRLFLFPTVPVQNPVISPVSSFNDSIEGRSDRDRFVDALNTGPVPVPVQSSTPAVLPVYGNADFLNIAPAHVPVPVQVSAPAQAPVTKVREFLDADLDSTDRIQKHIQDLQRLRISEDQQLQQQHQQQQMMYRRQSEDSMTSGYAGDYYRQAEKVTTTLPGNVPAPVSGYQMSGGFTGGDQQPLYMVPSSAGVYHAPMARPVPGPIGPAHGQGNGHGQSQLHGQGQGQGQGQGYYAVYNGMQPVQQQMAPQQQQQQQQKIVTNSEGIRMVQSTVGMTDQGYGQVAYDNGVGRHVYYTPQGAMVAPHQQQPPPQLQPQPQPQQQQMQHQYQAMGGGLGTLSQDAKVIGPAKNSQG